MKYNQTTQVKTGIKGFSKKKLFFWNFIDRFTPLNLEI